MTMANAYLEKLFGLAGRTAVVVGGGMPRSKEGNPITPLWPGLQMGDLAYGLMAQRA